MKKILCSRDQVNLKYTLLGGQSFRWKETNTDEYSGVFGGGFWVLQQKDDHIAYKRVPATDLDEKILSNYLRMDEPLDEYYKKWSLRDPTFKKLAERFKGIRILKQEPVENILSFICSTENNITRISSLIEKMCTLYGKKIEGTASYAFPDIETLIGSQIEEDLKVVKYGYKAKFIRQTAETMFELGSSEWIDKLRNMDYDSAKKELRRLPGVGPKIADCVCLMSLGHLDAVPVDTTAVQFARDNYLKNLKKFKTVNRHVYNRSQLCFRMVFRKNPGWAHRVLFVNNLKIFKQLEKHDDSSDGKPNAKRKKIC